MTVASNFFQGENRILSSEWKNMQHINWFDPMKSQAKVRNHTVEPVTNHGRMNNQSLHL
jgi:hypothetical protein